MNSIIKSLQYQHRVIWSKEDNCYVGSLPEICSDCCHADNEEDVHRQLDVIAQEWAEIETKQANCACRPCLLAIRFHLK